MLACQRLSSLEVLFEAEATPQSYQNESQITLEAEFSLRRDFSVMHFPRLAHCRTLEFASRYCLLKRLNRTLSSQPTTYFCLIFRQHTFKHLVI